MADSSPTTGELRVTPHRAFGHHFTTAEMLRTPQFYVMSAMFVLMATRGLLVTAQQGPIAQSWDYTLFPSTAADDFGTKHATSS